ncbi:MAG: hypothetical protein V1881_01750 [Candidatus Micrarchaeota archaeon]
MPVPRMIKRIGRGIGKGFRVVLVFSLLSGLAGFGGYAGSRARLDQKAIREIAKAEGRAYSPHQLKLVKAANSRAGYGTVYFVHNNKLHEIGVPDYVNARDIAPLLEKRDLAAAKWLMNKKIGTLQAKAEMDPEFAREVQNRVGSLNYRKYILSNLGTEADAHRVFTSGEIRAIDNAIKRIPPAKLAELQRKGDAKKTALTGALAVIASGPEAVVALIGARKRRRKLNEETSAA